MPQLSLHSPVGDLTISEEDGRIVSLDWGRAPAAFRAETPVLLEAKRQLEAYFTGQLTRFDLPLDPRGSAFQRRTWQALMDIPYGATASYGDIAARLGSAARAVGGACGANHIPIIIPCHRVLGAGGGLGGYSGEGGVATKRYLLLHESGHATAR